MAGTAEKGVEGVVVAVSDELDSDFDVSFCIISAATPSSLEGTGSILQTSSISHIKGKTASVWRRCTCFLLKLPAEGAEPWTGQSPRRSPVIHNERKDIYM